MFRPPVVAIFREAFSEGYITWDIKTNILSSDFVEPDVCVVTVNSYFYVVWC